MMLSKIAILVTILVLLICREVKAKDLFKYLLVSVGTWLGQVSCVHLVDLYLVD